MNGVERLDIAGGHSDRPPSRGWRSPVTTMGAAGAIGLAMAAALLIPGHFWGDDWTLYVRQAEGLIHGHVGDVLADARFTIRHSTVREFSPAGYPWGTPLLLATPLALFGRSIAAMKITMALCFGVATAAWMTVARRRLPSAAAIGAVGCMVISLPLVSWANLVGSDLPYLAVVGITVAAFARWTTSPVIGRHHAVALGALTALAFAFRQEGLLLLLAVLVAAVAPQLLRSRSRAGLRVTAARCGAITGVFLTLTVALHLVLPSQVLPRYTEAGLGQVRSNLRFFARTVGAQFGVYDTAHQRVAAVGSPLLGLLVAALIVTLISLGTLRMIVRHDALDILLLGTAAAHAFGALTFPYPDGRYMFVAVVVADLALGQGVSIVAIWIAGHVPAGRARVWHTAAIVAVIAGVAIGVQIPPYRDAALGASEARRIDLPAFSPYEPTAQAMFEAVRASTLPDDVVAFIHARAMTLFTDRRSVQIRPTDAVPAEARWLVAEVDPNGTLATPSRGSVVWTNGRYALIDTTVASG